MTLEPASDRGRVVVTGVGAVSGWGWGVAALEQGLRSGGTAIRRPERLDTARQRTRLAAEVPSPPAELAERLTRWRRLSWADRFAVAAAEEACRRAGADPRCSLTGVFFGTTTAGMAEAEVVVERLVTGAERALPLAGLATQQLNSPGDAVAREVGACGPVCSLSSACASGALAIRAALESVREGDVDIALAGGADSLCQLTYAGFNSLRAVDEQPCRPFRCGRAGMSLGEGAGVLVLETLAHARLRGARPLAELLGAGTSCDAFHMTAPDPEGTGAALAMTLALADAGADTGSVDFVNAHGTATPLSDESEATGLRNVFGPRLARLPLTANKAAIGHLLGSAGAIEAVATVLALAAGEVQPTSGDGLADPGLGVDLVRGRPRPLAADAVALSASLAFGGANAALIFGAWREGIR